MRRAAQDIGPCAILTHPRSYFQTRFDAAENAWCDQSHGAAHAPPEDDARQTAPLWERVWLMGVHVERSRACLVWQTVPLVERGRGGHVWEMAPVAGRGCDVQATVSLERPSWVELQGI
jgi:hypothetical protein